MIIDKIFAITLTTSTKRQENFKKRLPELTNSDIFEWYVSERDTEDSVRGCYNSHKGVLDLSKKRGYKTILIFEDDAVPLFPWSDIQKRISELKRPINWSIIQLGYLPIKLYKTSNKNLFKVNCSYNGQAYLVNVPNLDLPSYTGIPIDSKLFCDSNNHTDIFKKPYILETNIQDNIYCYYPMLFQQEFKDTSNGSNIQGMKDFFNLYNGPKHTATVSTYINLFEFIILIFIWLSLIVLIPIFATNGMKNTTYILLAVLIITIFTVIITVLVNNNRIVELEYE